MQMRELKQFCADSLDHLKQQADQWEEQGGGTVRCSCHGNHVRIGIRLRHLDSSLALCIFPYLFLNWLLRICSPWSLGAIKPGHRETTYSLR